MTPAPTVSRAAWALGLAGLLPQGAAVLLTAYGGPDWSAYGVELAFGYGSLILSFLGGIWWGFAMRRRVGQARLAALSVVPSLFAAALLVERLVASKAGIESERYNLWTLAALGAGILATLPVDARLKATGDVPAGWFRFRAVLSLGLGLMTIAAGAIYAQTTVTETWV